MAEYRYSAPRKGEKLPTYSENRGCSSPDCRTKLSIYNSSRYCWLHDNESTGPRISPTRP